MEASSYLMDDTYILERAQKWDKWDDVEKDMLPYLNEIFERLKEGPDELDEKSTIKYFYIFKLIITPKVEDIFAKTLKELSPVDEFEKAYSDVVADIVKLYHNSDELEGLLEDQTQLLDFEKDKFREDWEKQCSFKKTKEDEIEGMLEFQTQLSDSEKDKIRQVWKKQHSIEEIKEDDKKKLFEEGYLKAKFTKLGEYHAKIKEIGTRQRRICKARREIVCFGSWLRTPMASSDVINEQKELVQGMMAKYNIVEENIVEDNIVEEDMTYIVASSEDEDNIVDEDKIVASSELNLPTMKKKRKRESSSEDEDDKRSGRGMNVDEKALVWKNKTKSS